MAVSLIWFEGKSMNRYEALIGKSGNDEEKFEGPLILTTDTILLLNSSKKQYISAFVCRGLYYATVMVFLDNNNNAIWKMLITATKGYSTYDKACLKLRERLPLGYGDMEILPL